jgi:CRISPR/Cas system CSM-associated protein Csm3 (group 7 of RAMP superfamily)
LRARANELFDEAELIKLIFGYQDKEETWFKSRLFVEDAYYAKPAMTSLRDGVAIDRALGSARQGAKYDLEITLSDLELPLVIKLETREGDDEAKMRALVLRLMEDFKSGRIKLGAGKSRGLGACEFGYTWRSLDFSNPEQIRSYLCSRDIKAIPEKDASKSDINAGLKTKSFEELACVLDMMVEDALFLIKDGRGGDDCDAVFTRTMTKNGPQDYIPGSSIKGVIRAHAERILRTLGADACDILDTENGCNDKVKKALEKLEETKKGKPQEEEQVEEKRAGIIQENSCLICRLFGNAHLAGRIRFNDAFFDATPTKKSLDHVAIDRFTGGALEGKLFNELPVVHGTVRLGFLIKKPSTFDRCLVGFLLRDLMEGFPPIRFGYGKTKGHGALEFKKATINDAEIKNVTDINRALAITSTDNWWKGGDAHE